MKRTFLLISFFLSMSLATAQQSNIDKATMAMAVGDWNEAINAINDACKHKETRDNAKTWHSAGLIYATALHETKSFNHQWAEQSMKCVEQCRHLNPNREYNFDRIYFYIGESYYNECKKQLDKHEYKYAFTYASNAAKILLAGQRFYNAAEANNLMAVCKLGDANIETDTGKKCLLLKEAIAFLETSKHLSDGYDRTGTIKDNNDYLFNYAGKILYGIAEAFCGNQQYEKALQSARDAEICFANSEDVAMREQSLKIIELCENVLYKSDASNAVDIRADKMSPQATERKTDVDINVPVGVANSSNIYVFIVSNEDYPNRRVPYALNDGRIFAEYSNKTLGVPSNHIRVYENATCGNILACVANIKKASEANDGDINIIFYYAGHAFPDENTKDAYLLPVDGDSRLVETCYSLKRLYDELGKIKTHQVVCFLDACFSGATREDDMLLTGRGVAIKPKEETPQGNLIVFTSASGNETAHQYEEKQHGLFTYYLLKKMQDSKGSFTLGEMYDYVSKNVKKTSFDVNNKIQTPSVILSETMGTKWRNIKL